MYFKQLDTILYPPCVELSNIIDVSCHDLCIKSTKRYIFRIYFQILIIYNETSSALKSDVKYHFIIRIDINIHLKKKINIYTRVGLFFVYHKLIINKPQSSYISKSTYERGEIYVL